MCVRAYFVRMLKFAAPSTNVCNLLELRNPSASSYEKKNQNQKN